LYAVETRLAWTSGPLPGTPAEVILRHLADEQVLAAHPALNNWAMIWDFRRHRLCLFYMHLRQSWREVGKALDEWRRDAFHAGDWSRAGDGVRLLLRAARATAGLSFTALWTIGIGQPLPWGQKQVQRWAGSLAGSRLRLVNPSVAA